jgi:hypothetical protein
LGSTAKYVLLVPALGVLAVLISNPATATDWQVGLLGGYSSANKSDLLRGFQKDGFNGYFRQPFSADAAEKNAAIKLFARKSVLANFAVEANYTNYSELKWDYTADSGLNANPVSRQVVTAAGTRRVSAFGVDVFANFPMANNVAMELGAGVAYANVKFDGSLSSKSNALPTANITELSLTKRVFVPRVSAGFNWGVTPEWSVQGRFEYLAKVGTAFENAMDFHTGSSPQKTIWLGIARVF